MVIMVDLDLAHVLAHGRDHSYVIVVGSSDINLISQFDWVYAEEVALSTY